MRRRRNARGWGGSLGGCGSRRTFRVLGWQNVGVVADLKGRGVAAALGEGRGGGGVGGGEGRIGGGIEGGEQRRGRRGRGG